MCRVVESECGKSHGCKKMTENLQFIATRTNMKLDKFAISKGLHIPFSPMYPS